MDEIEQLEAELAGLQPRTPSAALERRIAEQLAAADDSAEHCPPSRGLAFLGTRRPRRVNRGWLLAAVALPIAAALAVLLSLARTGRVTGASGDMLKPVSAEKVLYAVSDEGTVTLQDGTTARRERLEYLDTIRWANPRTHASLTYTVPREEVRVTPISYQ